MAAKKTTTKVTDGLKTTGEKIAKAVDNVEKEVKKATRTRKTAAPKKAAEPVVTTTVEIFGKSIVVADVAAKAIEAFKASNEGTAIEKIELYIKPEENAAYYVVNGEGSADYRIEL